MGVDVESFKRTMASWASGVAIVTSRHGERVQGMTVSAFTSVSAEPPLVLICAERTTITHGLIQASGVFSVSVLAEDQQSLSDRFASKREEQRRFEGLTCESGETGCPRIPGAVAWLDCRVMQASEAADHVIHVAEVVAAEIEERAPLIYFRVGYRGLARTKQAS